ncbi:DNRLRE domain-containing protein [Algibacter sp. 2305UL17-15]|uniref:CBM96 family carbohydrate-binding protein n=1 Tax=Algibacter sp. 2305UL17-15 TaxID=3231268 RepID=UPI00345ABB98
MKKKNYLLLFCLTLLISGTSWATDYYVDATSGNDANSGTDAANAWQTLSKVSAFTFSPGDKLYFKAGEIWNGQVALSGSGTAGNPIVLDMYGAGNKPILNGGGLLTNTAATVLLHNVEYWEVNNLEITNTNGTTGYQGDLWGILGVLDLAGGMEANHIYIRDCYIHDVNGDVATKDTGGIYMTAFGTDQTRYNDLKIEDNVIENVGGLGIANQSTHASISSGTRYPSLNIVIRGNRINNTGRNNMIIRASDDAIVEHNTLANSSRYDTGHSVFCFNTDGVKIQYNEAYGNKGTGDKDRGGYDADYNCKNTKIQYNYSHDNYWGFAIMKKGVNENVVIRYNISENDEKAIYFYGFNWLEEMTRASVYNNTHYVKSGIQLAVFGSGAIGRTAFNTDFYNNIFYFEDAGSTWGSSNNVNFENNCFYNIAPLGTDYITSNPLLVNPGTGGQDIDWANYPNVLTGYKLQPTSPCVDAGKIINDNGGQDFWGETLYYGLPDIGAGEHPYTVVNNDPTDIQLSNNSLQENNTTPTLIGDFSTTDADATDTHTYEFTSGNGDVDNSSFSITGNQLFATQVFDYELQNSFSIRVRTLDNNGGIFDKIFIINVTDEVNESGSAIKIPVLADALVRDGSHDDNNYGTEDELQVKVASSGFTREAYLKFDVSSLVTAGNITDAKLVLEPSGGGTAASATQFQAKIVADDSWTETGITWNNKPAQGSVMDTQTGSTSATMEWDVKTQVISEVSGDGIISIALTSTPSGSQNFVKYHSKEQSNFELRPVLVVTADGNLSVDDVNKKKPDVIVYPNPVTNRVYFQNISEVERIEIMDISGKQIQSATSNMQTIKNSGLDIKRLTSGFYFFKFIDQSGNSVSKKVIVE